jgi:hypothetical protein
MPSSLSKKSVYLAVLVMLAVAAGCDTRSRATIIEPPMERVEDRSAGGDEISVVGNEESALRELTRAVALAMADQGLRMRLRQDLWASRYTTEHKLEFANYLRGHSGGILMAKMAKATGHDRDYLQALVSSVRPLELYMPSADHRQRWRGDEGVWVASLIEDDDVPTAFDTRGEPIMLTANSVPPVATLALVPSETDFSAPLPPLGFVNKNDQQGESIGTFEPCDDCVTTADHVPYGGRHGVVMTYLQLNDLREAFLKGRPEIEVHVMGAEASGSSTASLLDCAGGHLGNSVSYFDMNDHTWSNSEGVTLLSPAAYDQFVATQAPEALQIFVWEDDYAPCEIVSDVNFGTNLAYAAAVFGAGFGFYALTGSCGPVCNFVGGAALLYELYLIASGLAGNDDYIGGLTSVTYQGRNAVLVSGSTNGYMGIEYRPGSTYIPPPSGGGGCVDGICPTSHE